MRRLAIFVALLGGCQAAQKPAEPVQETAHETSGATGQPVGAAIETLGIT